MPSDPKFTEIHFDPIKLASGLMIEPQEAIQELSDGRVASRFSEHWAKNIYEFQKVKNSNNEGYDGFIDLPLGRIRIGIRSLTKNGIYYQQSKYIGSGRTCTLKNLRDSLINEDYVIVVDITRFPIVRMLPIKTHILLDLVDKKKLTPSAMKKDAFYKKVIKPNYSSITWDIING